MPRGQSTSVYWQPQTELRAKALADLAGCSVSQLVADLIDQLWRERNTLADTPADERAPYAVEHFDGIHEERVPEEAT